jgi:hypothetical protein
MRAVSGALESRKRMTTRQQSNSNTGCTINIGLGGVIAVILSWTTWHSIGWAIIHGLLGWFYVIYWAIMYSGGAG